MASLLGTLGAWRLTSSPCFALYLTNTVMAYESVSSLIHRVTWGNLDQPFHVSCVGAKDSICRVHTFSCFLSPSSFLLLLCCPNLVHSPSIPFSHLTWYGWLWKEAWEERFFSHHFSTCFFEVTAWSTLFYSPLYQVLFTLLVLMLNVDGVHR